MRKAEAKQQKKPSSRPPAAKKPSVRPISPVTRARSLEAPEAAAVWVPMGSLVPWAKNPRKNDHAVGGIVDSLIAFGWGRPLIAREANSELVAGHTTHKAALQLAERWAAASPDKRKAWHPDAVVTAERGIVPVRFVALSERKAHLLALADNRLAEASEWNDEALEELLREFAPEEVHIAGWSDDDLEKLARDVGKVQGADGVDEDEAPEVDFSKAVTKLGDVWELGRHRLICGDSTDPQVLAQLLGDNRVGLLATDPPYGVEVVGGAKDARDTKNYAKGNKIQNDELTGPKLEAFLRKAFAAGVAYMVAGASWYVWYADKETLAFVKAAEELGGFRHMLAWVKPHFVFGRGDYHYRHEPCLYGWKPGAAHAWLGDHKQSTVFECGRDDAIAQGIHPTVKPVHLYAVPIQNHLGSDGSVLDLFGGSGPVVSAAEQMGRRAFVCELSPNYCDVIVSRWERLTNGKAVRRAA